MKQIRLAVGILAILLIFCLVSAVLIRATCAQTSDLLQQAAEAAQNGDAGTVLQKTEAAQSAWESRERFFGVTLDHEEVDSVTVSFAALLQYAASDNLEDFLCVAPQVLVRLDHMKEMELPLMHNIF